MTEKPPKESTGDHIHRVARAGLSLIPYVGGPAVELFNWLVAPPLGRRRDEWLNGLAERLDNLGQEDRINFSDLKDNDEFISTVMQASSVAIRNHQQEKIDALRNAVLNTAIGQAPEDSIREMFVAFVDNLTVLHLRTLKAFYDNDNGKTGRKRIETTVSHIAEHAVRLVPDLSGQDELSVLLVDDLCRRGLLFWNRGGGVMIDAPRKQVTDLGRQFLSFISEPPDSKTEQ